MALIDYGQYLLDCVEITLTEAGAPPCSAFLAPSPTPPLDNCCLCGTNKDGQLWVSLTESVALNPFIGQPCGRQFRTVFRVGLTRCAHTVQDDGTAPTSSQIQSDAEKIYRDQTLLLKAITCCWADGELDLDPTQWAIVSSNVLPVQGGCMGQTVDVAVDLSLCSDC